jgi:hypothetical protein
MLFYDATVQQSPCGPAFTIPRDRHKSCMAIRVKWCRKKLKSMGEQDYNENSLVGTSDIWERACVLPIKLRSESDEVYSTVKRTGFGLTK